MAERLHYFTEASTPVSFDCSDSDIDSDLDDLSRRPISEIDRVKQHARQLQLWSDEARRRRSPALSPTPRRRPSTASLHDMPPSLLPEFCPPPSVRARQSHDRQQSNLSERARPPSSRRVSRSHSAKNLRIRITPSSSSKSLMSDIDSEIGNSIPPSAPQSPAVGVKTAVMAAEDRLAQLNIKNKEEKRLTTTVTEKKHKPVEKKVREFVPLEKSETEVEEEPEVESENNATEERQSSERAKLTRRMSFSVRGKRLLSLKRLWRRKNVTSTQKS